MGAVIGGFFCLFFGGACGVQDLSSSDQRLNLGHSSESTES